MIYFPKYTSNQTSEINYIFTILRVLRGKELKELIQEARKKRSIFEEPDINKFIEITDKVRKETDDMFTQKNKSIVIITSLKSQGKSMLMLKKGAKLGINRRLPAQYSANLEVLQKAQSINSYQI